MPNPGSELGPIRRLVAWIGAMFIYALIRVFGRTVRDADVPWLIGPVGGPYIGDRPYEEVAAREDHGIRFLGLRILHLHYRIDRRRDAEG